MTFTLNRAKAEDYVKWKSAFGAPEGKTARKAAGAKSWQIFRNADDPNEIIVLIEWDNIDNARKYYQNKEFLQRQPGIGVLVNSLYKDCGWTTLKRLKESPSD